MARSQSKGNHASVSPFDAQPAARHSEALIAWLADPVRSGPALGAIASAPSKQGDIPLGVAVERLSSHHDACEMPRTMWLPTQADATVLVFARGQEALDAVTSSIFAACAHGAARTGAGAAKPTVIASTHLEELAVPSLLAHATAVLVLADASGEEAHCLVGVSAARCQEPDPCDQPSAWWRQHGAVYAVELARWQALD